MDFTVLRRCFRFTDRYRKSSQKKSSQKAILEKYKKRCGILRLLCVMLLMIVVGMFVVATTSNSPNILNYEEKIQNKGKNWEEWQMNQCCLVWEISTIEGEHYNPITYAIYVRKAKKFSEKLNQYFQSKKMDWECILDHSACTYDEIFSGDNQAVIFVPEAKTRQWLYKKDVQVTRTPTYYLDFAEYNEDQWDKLVEFFEVIKA